MYQRQSEHGTCVDVAQRDLRALDVDALRVYARECALARSAAVREHLRLAHDVISLTRDGWTRTHAPERLRAARQRVADAERRAAAYERERVRARDAVRAASVSR